ncbi:unnamed protein product [Blepharisma stoltei]|uniref:CUE domain-containing protein n=1 Tax=Blepharisma stoltei TaxID=1481888 RepID=A0AAU9JNC5_9CILI|nr:unnamed protein product [Blepharisma stoltei]
MESPYKKQVDYLTSMFPQLDAEIIESILESCEGSVNKATDYLLRLDEESYSKSSLSNEPDPPIINAPNLPPPIQAPQLKKAASEPPKVHQEPNVVLNDDFLELGDPDSEEDIPNQEQEEYLDPIEQERKLQQIIEESILEANKQEKQKKPKKTPFGQRFKAKVKKIFGKEEKKVEENNQPVKAQREPAKAQKESFPHINNEMTVETIDADEDVYRFYSPNNPALVKGESLNNQKH